MSRDEILADFQACAGIEDFGQAFTYLDSSNWDLTEALQKVASDQQRHDSDLSFMNVNDHVPMPISAFTSVFPAGPHQVDVIDIDSPQEEVQISLTNNAYEGGRTAGSSSSGVNEPPSIASSSKSPQEGLFINIQIVSDSSTDGNSFPLELPLSTTVGELKTLLHQLVGIPPCSQVLEGFVRPVVDPYTVITRDLLPKTMSLSLNTGSLVVNQPERHNGSVPDEFTLLIRDEKNSKDYRLPYPAVKRVTEVKSDVFQLTGIHVRHQLWTGWPPVLGEQSTLGSIGISKEHQLTVSQHVPERTPKCQRKSPRATGAEASEENSSADEFEDASELLPEEDFLIMCDAPPSPSSQPLIPANVGDELTGVLSFVDKFEKRYGSCIPLFFHGTLESALKGSVMLPAKNRKPLAVYLHHDKSVSVNVFCSQSLCSVSVVDYLSTNYITWGWDLTHESNKTLLLELVSSNLGIMASSTVRSYSLEKLPALLIINRSRGSIEILSVIHGNSNLEEVMASLLQASEIFEEQRQPEVLEENLREQRETVISEQNAAYRASLEADRAKAQAKRKAELEERVERERQQSIKEQGEALKEAVRASLEMELPNEPGPSCTEPTAVLRFRVPKSEHFHRVFTRSTPLQTVLNFLCVKGYPPDEYKYIQSWPRRCITLLDPMKTLDQLKMPNQETINVEERIEGED